MSYAAAYLTGSGGTDHVLGDLTARVVPPGPRLRGLGGPQELGRSGVADLVDRSCAHARRFAELLAGGRRGVYNDVVLNQVLVGFGDDCSQHRCRRRGGAARRHLLAGRHHLARQTPDADLGVELDHDRADIDRSAEAILRAAASARAKAR